MDFTRDRIPEVAQPERPREPARAPTAPERVLEMQRSAGNAAVSRVLARDTPPAAPAAAAAPAAPAADPLSAPLTDAEWRGINIWQSRGEVGIDKLTEDPDHNAGVIAAAIFLERLIRSPEFGQGDPLLGIDLQVTLADPRVQVLKGHVNARGPIKHWPAVPLGDRQSYVMNLLVTVHGFPVNGAAGIVGNLTAESGVIPSRVEGSAEDTPMRAKNQKKKKTDFDPDEVMNRTDAEGPDKPGVGIAQWTSPARRTGLFTAGGGSGVLFDMDAQVAFLVSEIQGRGSVNGVVSGSGVSVNAASDEIVYNFEIPKAVLKTGGGKLPRSDPQVVAVFEERRALAAGSLAAYQRFLAAQAAAAGGAPAP